MTWLVVIRVLGSGLVIPGRAMEVGPLGPGSWVVVLLVLEIEVVSVSGVLIA